MQPKPEPPTPSPWPRRLRTVSGCRRELGRLYGEARDGGEGWGDTAKAAYVLFTITRMLAGTETEQRLGPAIEKAPSPSTTAASGRSPTATDPARSEHDLRHPPHQGAAAARAHRSAAP